MDQPAAFEISDKDRFRIAFDDEPDLVEVCCEGGGVNTRQRQNIFKHQNQVKGVGLHPVFPYATIIQEEILNYHYMLFQKTRNYAKYGLHI